MTDRELNATEMRAFVEQVEAHREKEAEMMRALAPNDRVVAKEALEQRAIAREATEYADSVIGSCDFDYDAATGENVRKAPA